MRLDDAARRCGHAFLSRASEAAGKRAFPLRRELRWSKILALYQGISGSFGGRRPSMWRRDMGQVASRPADSGEAMGERGAGR